MSAADWYAAQQAIEAYARAAAGYAYVDVFTGQAPDNWDMTRPYVVLRFSGQLDVLKHQGITGAKENSYTGQFNVSSVALTDKDARKLSQIGRDLFIGFVPNQFCGEVTPAFFAGVGEISSLTNPTRYSADQAYDVTVNASL